MTKFLALSSLLVISTLTTACSDEKEQVKQLKGEVKAAQQLNPQDLTAEQQEELKQRKDRASQKGNILDEYDPSALEKPIEPETKKGSGNILDGYNPDSK
ncbi:hypothetical protein [Acinetobacter sp. CIP 102136]|jgi:hypothetical protein|uniref:hypothetical protein n=1 Tax=Acinetobacter sp. CIP 102136 TaxID=1144665 RepID=UPI0002CDA494|nr:hypothetical protein [Acinetobacter sp. CIP 102136]ENX18532.1 hypothetical protein F893_03303 [Acinetobacter sp. CIP 102136]